jgi:hypothetical protein
MDAMALMNGDAMRRALGMVALVVVVVVTAAGCGDGEDPDQVASLSTEDGASDTENGGDGDDGGGGDGEVSEEEAEEAMLEFTECMREHGVDMPDPDTSGPGGGAVFIGPGGDGDEPDMEEFEAADEACRHLIEGVMGPGRELSPEEEAEMQDQALAMAQCMRDHGIDMPDPQFDEGGMISQEMRDIDPMSEEFQEAQEACAEEAGIEGGIFAGPGPGPGGGRGGADERPAANGEEDE